MSTAPPIGLAPKWVRSLERAHEILEAMTRYVEARKPIPQTWIDEFIEVAGVEEPNGKAV